MVVSGNNRFCIRYTMKESEEFDPFSPGFYSVIIKWITKGSLSPKAIWCYEKGKEGVQHVHIYVEGISKNPKAKVRGNWFNRHGYTGSNWYFKESDKSQVQNLAYVLKDGKTDSSGFSDKELYLGNCDMKRQKREFRAQKLLAGKTSQYAKYLDICRKSLCIVGENGKKPVIITKNKIFDVIYDVTVNSNKMMLNQNRFIDLINAIFHKLNWGNKTVKLGYKMSILNKLSSWDSKKDLLVHDIHGTEVRGIEYSKRVIYNSN